MRTRQRFRAARPGLDRSDTPHVWASSLSYASGDKPIVYLDMCHWINLARAATGRTQWAAFVGALEAVRAAAEQVLFPVASVHYMEIQSNNSQRRRGDVAATMEELSGYVCLRSRSEVVRVELDAALAQLFGTPTRHSGAQLLRRGVLNAFGRRGGLRAYHDNDGDITETLRETWAPGAFDALSRAADTLLTRTVLRGPAPGDVPALLAGGWDPSAASRIAEDRARSERELVTMLDARPEYRRERLRDVVSARYVASELLDALNESIGANALSLQELVNDVHVARQFADSMPSGDAWISLLTTAHRNPQNPWRPNDIFDFDALSVAIPYCDVVVTDKHACRLASDAGLPERFGTTVIANLDQLVATLDTLKRKTVLRGVEPS